MTETYQVQVPTTKTVERQYTVSVPVWTDQAQTYTVMVPAFETRQGMRCVQHCVPVQQTLTRCVDKGHWEDRQVAACSSGCNVRCCGYNAGASCGGDSCSTCGGSSCGGCATACTQTVRCYVPNWVNETYHVTVNKIETAQEPYTYQVQVCKPETRSCTVKVCHFETQTRTCSEQVCEYHCENRNRTYQLTECSLEQRSREVPYTVCVPKMETRNEQITVCEIHQVPKSENYTVMVPHTVQKTVQVQVCKMVEQTVEVPCATTSCGDSCCPLRWHRRWRCGC